MNTGVCIISSTLPLASTSIATANTLYSAEWNLEEKNLAAEMKSIAELWRIDFFFFFFCS